jgi:hypothetical protein
MHQHAGRLRHGLRLLRHRADGLHAPPVCGGDRRPGHLLCPRAGARGEHVTNIVMMGMGEPLHNYDNTLAAVDRLTDAAGLNLGARKITISTVGLVPAIRRYADEQRQTPLAISLHAATTRSAAVCCRSIAAGPSPS